MRPDFILDDIYDLEPFGLKEEGINAMILDLDNTVIAWNTFDVPRRLTDWTADMKRHGIQIMLVSNNNEPRVHAVAGKMGVPYIAKAGKPLAHAYQNALSRLSCMKDEVLAVGDKVLQDIWGAKRFGIRAALVEPINKKEFFLMYPVRAIERSLKNKWLKDL